MNDSHTNWISSRGPASPIPANGYRYRDFDTPGGQGRCRDPKAAQWQLLPGQLLERRRRAEAAPLSVVATSYLLGVSTRRMEKLVATLGIDWLSLSQVSAMAKDLDAQVEAFRTRPLDAGPYTFLSADALALKVRESAGAVQTVAVARASSARPTGVCVARSCLLNMKSRGRLTQSAAISWPCRR